MRCKSCGFVFFDKREKCPKCGTALIKLEEVNTKDDYKETDVTIPLFEKDDKTDVKEDTISYIKRDTTSARRELKKVKDTEMRTRKIHRRVESHPPFSMRVLGTLIDEIILLFIFLIAVWLPFYISTQKVFPSHLTIAVWWTIMGMVVHIFYYPFAHYFSHSSFGKMVVGIKIMHGQKEFPSLFLFFVKTLFGVIFTVVCFINWIYTFFNVERLPLQDVLLGFKYVETD